MTIRLPLPEDMSPEQIKAMASKLREFVYWNRIAMGKAEGVAAALEDGDLAVAQALSVEFERMLDEREFPVD